MRTRIKSYCRRNCGFALVLSMIFLLVFSTLAVSVAAMAGVNAQIAKNHHTTNTAVSAAQSGLEIFRYWLSDLSVPLSLSADQRLTAIADELQSRLTEAELSNISINYNGSEITVYAVNLDSQFGQNFTAVIRQIDDDTLQFDVTGISGQISRTIRTHFGFVSRADLIFDYGIATRGSLHMSGNVGLEVAVGSSVYIDGESADYALMMEGNSKISGDVSISDPYASVSLGGNSTISGQSGQEAIDNHVSIGADAIVFPAPDVNSFEQYVQNVVDANTDTSVDLVLDNIRIAADTNPDFTGNVTLMGIVFIEQPNIVTFTGDVTVTGIIIGNGDIQAPSDLNQIVFSNNINTYSVSQLPDEDKFAGLRDKTGSFLLAPGFSAFFSDIGVDNGVIAANGVSFSDNAGGNIQGTIIDYSQTQMSISGSSNLILNPSSTSESPAGFVPIIALEFVPDSYSEVANSSL